MALDLNNPDTFLERVAEVLTEEQNQPLLTWWLSFADATGFLGVVLVDRCPGLAHARLQMTLNLVPSPGGEIAGYGFDPTDGPPDRVAALAKLPRLTLLNKADLEAAGLILWRG